MKMHIDRKMAGPVSANLSLVVGGRVALLGLAFAANVLLIRALDPAGYGVYALALASVRAASTLLGDAVDLAVLRRVPIYLKEDCARAMGLVRASFLLRMIAGGAMCALAFAFGPLAADVLRWPAPVSLIFLAGVGIVGDQCIRAVMGFLQASGTFGRFMILEAVLQSGRFALIAALVAMDRARPDLALCAYVVMPFVAFGVGLLLIPRELLAPRVPVKREVAEVYHYARLMIVVLAVAAVYDRVDMFLLGALRHPDEVGVYAAALALVTMAEFAEGCLATVLHPRLVEQHREGRFPDLYRSYLKWMIPGLGIVTAAAMLGGGWLISVVFGENYVDAIPVFRIQIVGASIWLAIAPLPSALVAMAAPRSMLTVNAVALVVRVVAGLTAISAFGAVGAAGVFAVMRVAVALWLVHLARVLVRREPGEPIAVEVGSSFPRTVS
jgi:O-antigen/teichoic acid export membrane protein